MWTFKLQLLIDVFILQKCTKASIIQPTLEIVIIFSLILELKIRPRGIFSNQVGKNLCDERNLLPDWNKIDIVGTNPNCLNMFLRAWKWYETEFNCVCFVIQDFNSSDILGRPQKFEKKIHLVLTFLSNFKTRWGIFSNFVAFSHYLNFMHKKRKRD